MSSSDLLSSCCHALLSIIIRTFIPLSCRNDAEDERPSFCDVAVELQRPDFQILKWSTSDEAQYSKSARTLANPIEKGRGLYPELQKMYLRKNGVRITAEDQPARGPKTADNSMTSGQGSSHATAAVLVAAPVEPVSLTSGLSLKTSSVHIGPEIENGDQQCADGYDFVGESEYA